MEEDAGVYKELTILRQQNHNMKLALEYVKDNSNDSIAILAVVELTLKQLEPTPEGP